MDQLFCQFLEGLKLDFQVRSAPECDQDTRGKPLDNLASHLLRAGHRKKRHRVAEAGKCPPLSDCTQIPEFCCSASFSSRCFDLKSDPLSVYKTSGIPQISQ
jgi:hypothetical protein